METTESESQNPTELQTQVAEVEEMDVEVLKQNIPDPNPDESPKAVAVEENGVFYSLIFKLGIFSFSAILLAFVTWILAQESATDTAAIGRAYAVLFATTITLASLCAIYSYSIKKDNWWSQFYMGISQALLFAFILSIISYITVERLQLRSTDLQERDLFLEQVGSPINTIAYNALVELRENQWLQERDESEPANNLSDHLLNDKNLRGANLSYGELDNLNLIRTDLRVTDLKAANLANSDLSCALFTGSNLEDATLTRTILHGTKFDRTVLINADLRNARLNNTSFIGADLTNADINQAVNVRSFDQTSDEDSETGGCEEDSLNGYYVSFDNAILVGLDAVDANFSNFSFQDANMTNGKFAGVNFSGANLVGADLTDADLVLAQINSETLFDETTILPDGNPYTGLSRDEWLSRFSVLYNE